MTAAQDIAGKDLERRIAAVRRFNRFYTRQIGVLRKTYLDSPYSLGESRLLYEIAQRGAVTASEIGRALDLDAGYLSRVLRDFEERGLIVRKASATDARQSHVTLTARGRKTFAPLEHRSQGSTAAMLGALDAAEQTRLTEAMATIESLLGGTGDKTSAAAAPSYRLRTPKPGDFGWIVKRHAELYAQEYGWTEPFEGVCAQIVADFVNKFDPQTRALLDRRDQRRQCRLDHAGQGDRHHGPHPLAAGRSFSARARSRRAAHRRMHPLRAARQIPKNHAVDPQRARSRAPHLRESRL